MKSTINLLSAEFSDSMLSVQIGSLLAQELTS